MAFIDDHRDRFGVEPICRVLSGHLYWRIAPSTYYAAKSRQPSARAVRDAELVEEIIRVFYDRQKGRGVSGARKIWRYLARDGVRVGRGRVERLMRQAGLRGIRRGKAFRTTTADASAQRPPDRVNRQFCAERPNQLWVVDFTYVPTATGMVFTAFVTDVFSRRIVGWRTASRMPTELPLDALDMAVWIRHGEGHDLHGLIHHSDAGRQYTAVRYAERLADLGALASIGSIGDSYDNALAETVIGLYKTECVNFDGPFHDAGDLELATLSWVSWFNDDRLHSSIGYLTPREAEQEYYRENTSQPQPRPGETALH